MNTDLRILPIAVLPALRFGAGMPTYPKHAGRTLAVGPSRLMRASSLPG